MDYHGSRLGLLWTSMDLHRLIVVAHGSPMDLPLVPMGDPWAPMGESPREIHGSPMGLRSPTSMDDPWATHGAPCRTHGLPWVAHGSLVGSLGTPMGAHGSPMGFHWRPMSSHGFPLETRRLTWTSVEDLWAPMSSPRRRCSGLLVQCSYNIGLGVPYIIGILKQ